MFQDARPPLVYAVKTTSSMEETKKFIFLWMITQNSPQWCWDDKQHYKTMKNLIVNWFKQLIIDVFDEEFKKRLTPEKIQSINDPHLITSEGGLKIRWSEKTKDERKFYLSKPCWLDSFSYFLVFAPFVVEEETYLSTGRWTGGNFLDSYSKASTQQVEFISRIFSVCGISKLEAISAYEINITKTGALSWEEIMPKLFEAIQVFLKKQELVEAS